MVCFKYEIFYKYEILFTIAYFDNSVCTEGPNDDDNKIKFQILGR